MKFKSSSIFSLVLVCLAPAFPKTRASPLSDLICTGETYSSSASGKAQLKREATSSTSPVAASNVLECTGSVAPPRSDSEQMQRRSPKGGKSNTSPDTTSSNPSNSDEDEGDSGAGLNLDGTNSDDSSTSDDSNPGVGMDLNAITPDKTSAADPEITDAPVLQVPGSPTSASEVITTRVNNTGSSTSGHMQATVLTTQPQNLQISDQCRQATVSLSSILFIALVVTILRF